MYFFYIKQGSTFWNIHNNGDNWRVYSGLHNIYLYVYISMVALAVTYMEDTCIVNYIFNYLFVAVHFGKNKR